MWHLAKDSGGLDLNSPYNYLLVCRDFSSTSVVAREGDRIAGFVIGYVPPHDADSLFVWQVAVRTDCRGRRLARRMLDHLGDVMAATGCRYLTATITPDNVASTRLFESFARAHGAAVVREAGFDAAQFPVPHPSEALFRIGPIA